MPISSADKTDVFPFFLDTVLGPARRVRRVERDDLVGDEPIEEHRMEARCCLTAGLGCFVIKSSMDPGDGALEACRGGFVHFAHTSSSDRGRDLVRAEFIACCQGHFVESVQLEYGVRR